MHRKPKDRSPSAALPRGIARALGFRGEKAKSSWTHLDDSASEWRSLWDGVSSHLAAPLRRGSLFPPPVLPERTAGGGATSTCPPDRENCTLTAWYRFLYAPPAGGAYDSHHRAAGNAGCRRRAGG